MNERSRRTGVSNWQIGPHFTIRANILLIGNDITLLFPGVDWFSGTVLLENPNDSVHQVEMICIKREFGEMMCTRGFYMMMIFDRRAPLFAKPRVLLAPPWIDLWNWGRQLLGTLEGWVGGSADGWLSGYSLRRIENDQLRCASLLHGWSQYWPAVAEATYDQSIDVTALCYTWESRWLAG